MNRLSSIVLPVIGAGLIWAAGRLHSPLLDMRARYRFGSADPLDNAPPVIVITSVVLGGFSGLIADVLWLRCSYLKDEGRYFELVQLADWITKLEPRSTEGWAFHSWNMAFNLSALMPGASDRWRWVQNGIRLLRDYGIRYNAADPKLYAELALMYQLKIGSNTDPAHLYYKSELAREMALLLGGGRPDYERLLAEPDGNRQLRRECRLDPETMKAIDGLYGPLDWRLPWAHAIYWACKGKEQAAGGISLPCDRVIFQTMTLVFREGKVLNLPEHGNIEIGPAYEILPRVIAAYEAAMKLYDGEETVRDSYRNFLESAVLALHEAGRTVEAKNTFELLQSRFPSERTGKGLDDWIEQAASAAKQTDERR